MGYTLDAFGKPVFDDVYSFPADSQANADFAAGFANVRIGTGAERQALPVSKQHPGMLWVETDTKDILRTDGAGAWSNILGGEIVNLTSFSANWSATSGYAPYMLVEGNKRTIFGAATRGGGGSTASILTVPSGHRPTANAFLSGSATSAGVTFVPGIQPSGVIWIPYGGGSSAGAYPLAGSWLVA